MLNALMQHLTISRKLHSVRVYSSWCSFSDFHSGSLFPNDFTRSDAENYLLPDPHAESSTGPHHMSTPSPSAPLPTDWPDVEEDGQAAQTETEKSKHKGRGRPRGSKNRPKPPTIKPPRPPKPTGRPKGRPRKQRTAEELAVYEQKIRDKSLGIKRPRGRPRKFEGYLVREVRLKRHRDTYLALMRGWEDGGRMGNEPVHGDTDDMGLGGDVEDAMHIDGDTMDPNLDGDEVYAAWGHEGQSLLEAVGHLEAQQGVTSGDVEHNDDADMREVFGLPAQ
jgi:hypothetical protein